MRSVHEEKDNEGLYWYAVRGLSLQCQINNLNSHQKAKRIPNLKRQLLCNCTQEGFKSTCPCLQEVVLAIQSTTRGAANACSKAQQLSVALESVKGL